MPAIVVSGGPFTIINQKIQYSDSVFYSKQTLAPSLSKYDGGSQGHSTPGLRLNVLL